MKGLKWSSRSGGGERDLKLAGTFARRQESLERSGGVAVDLQAFFFRAALRRLTSLGGLFCHRLSEVLQFTVLGWGAQDVPRPGVEPGRPCATRTTRVQGGRVYQFHHRGTTRAAGCSGGSGVNRFPAATSFGPSCAALHPSSFRFASSLHLKLAHLVDEIEDQLAFIAAQVEQVDVAAQRDCAA